MHHSQIVEDINTAVHHAIRDDLHLLDEAALTARSDAMLQSLPIMGGQQPTTTALLRHYHSELHAELCVNHQPRIAAASVEDELRELTRAVVVAMGGDEGLPIDSAALVGLVLYAQGLVKFCALPAGAPGIE